MAEQKRRLVVEITGDAKGVSAAFAEVEGASSKTTGVLSKAGGFLRDHFAITAGDVAGAFRFAGDTLVSFGQAAIEDQAAAEKLATTLRNVTGATDTQIAAVEKYINGLQNQTGVLDDELRPAYDRILRSTGDAAKSQQLLALATDIAAGSGQDLGKVAEALGKAADGQTGALRKLGIETKNAAGETLSFEDLVSSLSDTFGGQAAVAAGTTEGRFKVLQARFSDVQEEIGAKLIPIALTLSDWFMNVGLPAVQTFAAFITENVVPALEQFGAWVVEHKDYLIAAVAGLAAVAAAVLVPAFLSWAAAAAAAAVATLTAAAPFIAIGAVIAAVAAGIVYAYKNFDTFRNVIDTVRGFIVERVWPVLKTLGEVYIGAVVTCVEKLWKAFVTFKDVAVDALNSVRDVAKTVFNAVARFWNSTFGAISFEVPGWVPGIGGRGFDVPDIPMLAQGGIVTRPTVALIGEAGPEAVVPLTGPNAASAGMVVNFYGPVGTVDEALLDRERTWALKTRSW